MGVGKLWSGKELAEGLVSGYGCGNVWKTGEDHRNLQAARLTIILEECLIYCREYG
jgi:hypothetical protein